MHYFLTQLNDSFIYLERHRSEIWLYKVHEKYLLTNVPLFRVNLVQENNKYFNQFTNISAKPPVPTVLIQTVFGHHHPLFP